MGTEIRKMVRFAWREDRSPESLARGLAIGLFVAFLPLPAFQAVLAFFIAHVIGVNRALAVAATLVTNWFTMAPVFIASVWTGSLLLPGISVSAVIPEEFTWAALKLVSSDVLVAYVVGTLFFSLVTSVTGYIVLRAYAHRQERRRWQRVQEP